MENIFKDNHIDQVCDGIAIKMLEMKVEKITRQSITTCFDIFINAICANVEISLCSELESLPPFPDD